MRGWLIILAVLIVMYCVSLFIGWAWTLMVALFVGIGAAAFRWRDLVAFFNARKAELHHLGLWLKMAAGPKDERTHMAMAHQQQFLSGSAFSPIQLLGLWPLIIALGAGGLFGWEKFRADRLERQRDAPCSDRELSRDGDGEFRTTRAACASLGATNEAALLWEAEARRIEAERDNEIATVRREAGEDMARLQRAAQRRAASEARQRRNINEGIEAALGGGPPDLERRLCELAGRLDCASTGSAPDSVAAPAAPISVRDGTSGASSEQPAGTPASDGATGR